MSFNTRERNTHAGGTDLLPKRVMEALVRDVQPSEQTPVAVLIRGTPGSGKNTIAPLFLQRWFPDRQFVNLKRAMGHPRTIVMTPSTTIPYAGTEASDTGTRDLGGPR